MFYAMHVCLLIVNATVIILCLAISERQPPGATTLPAEQAVP